MHYRDAKLVLKAYTLGHQKKTSDGIKGVTQTPIKASAVHTPRQVAPAKRLAMENWLQRNGAITTKQNPGLLPVFPGKTALY